MPRQVAGLLCGSPARQEKGQRPELDITHQQLPIIPWLCFLTLGNMFSEKEKEKKKSTQDTCPHGSAHSWTFWSTHPTNTSVLEELFSPTYKVTSASSRTCPKDIYLSRSSVVTWGKEAVCLYVNGSGHRVWIKSVQSLWNWKLK